MNSVLKPNTPAPDSPKPEHMSAPRLLVVVAHPDDETFGCGSLLLYAAARGAHTVVVCATRGEAGEVVDGVDAPHGVADLREAELRAAARLLGVAEVDVLNFVDSGMDGEPSPDALCGVPVGQVSGAVAAAVDRHRPDVVVTLDGGDGHRDHLRIRGVVEQILAPTPIPVYLHALPRSLMQPGFVTMPVTSTRRPTPSCPRSGPPTKS